MPRRRCPSDVWSRGAAATRSDACSPDSAAAPPRLPFGRLEPRRRRDPLGYRLIHAAAPPGRARSLPRRRSLGAAVVVDAVANGGVAPVKVALLGPQCMIDGAPPVPEWGARLGVRVLRSWPLRALANRIAYKDKSLGTKDAIRVGLLHCERDGWEDDAVAWLLGGGYSVSELVSPALRDAETLILWGESDEILPPADALPQFVEALPGADIRYVAECGHVPHLEQPGATATALARFLDEGANLGYVSGTTSVASAR